MPKKTSTAATDPDTVELPKRFPDNAQIQVRVDPQHPDRSVADLSMEFVLVRSDMNPVGFS